MVVHEIITINKIFNVRFFIDNLLQKSKSFYGVITKRYHAVSGQGLGKQIHFHIFLKA